MCDVVGVAKQVSMLLFGSRGVSQNGLVSWVAIRSTTTTSTLLRTVCVFFSPLIRADTHTHFLLYFFYTLNEKKNSALIHI